MSDLKTPYEIIVLGDMSGKAKASMWENLAGQAKHEVVDMFPVSMSGKEHREQFELYLEPSEEEYMLEYHSDKSDMWVYKKKGASYLNKRKYLPSAYRTAKSVALNCLEHGVKMHDDDGNVIAKSECEKRYSKVKRESNMSEKSNTERASALLDKLEKVYDTMDSSERGWLYDEVRGKIQ